MMMGSPESIDRPSYDHVVEDVLEQLIMGSSFEELFQSIYDQLQGIVPYNRIGVALLEEPGLLRLTSCRSDGPMVLKVGYAAHLEGSTLQPLLETGQPRIINDLAGYLTRRPDSASTELMVREGMASSLTLPLVADGKPIGAVFFSGRQKGIYTEQHAAILKRLAGHIAIGIEKARLITELQQRNRELADANKTKDEFLQLLRNEVDRQTQQLRKSEERYRRLVELGHIVSSSLEVRQVFEHTAGQIRGLLGCDRVSLLLLQGRENSRYGFAIEYGREQRWVDIPALSLPGSAVQWVMERRIPRVARRLDEERPFPEDQRLFERGYRSYAYLPLECRDHGLGVVGMASRQQCAPDQWDFDLLRELCKQLAIALDNASAYGEIARLKAQLEEQNVYLRDEIKTDHDFRNIIGNSRAMQEVRRSIKQVADTASTVLILGETGTGKELIGRAIHDLSPRKDKLLVKVNCAALAPGIITSELFGHEAGAFTGAADRRQGRFELAHQGSIFLDEIAEIPPETQVMLLRVLQERVIERVGGNEPIEVDTRVIAATNRNLKTHVDEGHFRDDLFYRLHVFPIQVPPLRDRREDIPSLINHFIGRFSRRMNREITRVNRRTMELLMNYDWPGNVRELENIIERAMIISHGDTLDIDATWLSEGAEVANRSPEAPSLSEIERRAILDALEQCGGKVYGPGGAAKQLGVKPTTLYGKMRKHGISRRRDTFECS